MFQIQTPNAPIVKPKMNTGKECSSAECARLRSRLHCVTTRRVASTRQGVRRAPQFDFRHRQASCASPCEIMPAPRLPIVFAVFHRACHATRCPCGIRILECVETSALSRADKIIFPIQQRTHLPFVARPARPPGHRPGANVRFCDGRGDGQS